MQLPPRKAARGLLDDALDAGGLPLVPLEWHYRSGDPSLIAVSDALFYGGRLVAPGRAPGGPGGLAVVEVRGAMTSSRGPPAGLVNEAQAERLVADARKLVMAADAARKPLSLGVITLNRPQRGLIRARLLADASAGLEDHPDVRGALRRSKAARSGWAARDLAALDGDPPVFVESIDRIQGEERDAILLSTLLAPREDGAVPDDAALDHLEDADDSASSDDERAPGKTPRRARRGGGTARHYSTLSHAHGHRLLNVGLSRAVETMVRDRARIGRRFRDVAAERSRARSRRRRFGRCLDDGSQRVLDARPKRLRRNCRVCLHGRRVEDFRVPRRCATRTLSAPRRTRTTRGRAAAPSAGSRGSC